MNNRKSKAKKRKLSDLEESSGDDSSDKGEDLDSDAEEKNSGGEDEEGSSSEGSHSSTESQSSSGSSVKHFKKSRSSAPDAFLSDTSDSGDENCEKCAICLRSITSQEVGNPEVCDHIFCSVCIIEWSKNSNVCPLDRQQFSIILVRENKNGKVAKKVPVEESQAARADNVEFEGVDDTVCEICGFGDREDILLLCDICDRGFHTVCLTPPLENIPDENEWFCPDCDLRAPNTATESLAEFFDIPSTSRSLRPRIQLVRTRLLERIRVTVNRIVRNYVLQHPTELDSSDYESELESLGGDFTSESDSEVSDVQPDTSDPSPGQAKRKKSQSKTRKRKTTRSRKRKTTKKTTTRKRKTASTKKKNSSTGMRKTKKRKTRVRTTRTKRVKVENADGTITEKIVKTRTYKKRRKQKRKKYKVKSLGTTRRGLRVKSVTTPKTVKGRLALTLGMVPPKKPGQLLPDIKVRPPNSHISAIDLNRARAGIPKLHIFGPRDELQYYSSDSDREEFIGGGSGGVATVVPQRSSALRLRDRKKAALALQSMPPSTTPKPKPVIEPPTSEYVDILGSILDSQAVWHSKNTNVKINEDGSIEVIKDKDNNNRVAATGAENNNTLDVREGKPEGLTTQAPMQPGTGSRPGGFRPRSSYGENRSGGGENTFSPRTGQSSTGVNFNRFGAPARNDREGYTNYLNNIPQGPTPFCRGGPPLRFRMPPRQQLRRITIPVRNRPGWQREEEDEEENDKDKEKDDNGAEKGGGGGGVGGGGGEENSEEAQTKKQDEEDDIDLYSDIETSAEKGDNSGAEDAPPSFPALGPPPEPPAFLLGLEENGEFGMVENKDKSEVYDPAEPCDSEDEMVIDENKEQSPPLEKKEPEQKAEPPSDSTKLEAPKRSSQKASSEEDDDDEDCPIFSIYSSATREFSQKEEEERQREIQEERRKIEELKLQEGKSSPAIENTENVEQTEEDLSEKLTEGVAERHQEGDNRTDKAEKGEPVEREQKLEEKEYQESCSPGAKSGRETRSRSKTPAGDKLAQRERSPSSESERDKKSKSPASGRDKSSSPDRKYKRSKRKSKTYDSDSDEEAAKLDQRSDDDKENEGAKVKSGRKDDEDKSEKGEEESESEAVSQKVATGLEGLEVEEVSSDNGDGAEFGEKRSLSSLSLSELSHTSKRSRSPVQTKKKNKRKKKKIGKAKPGKNYEEGEIDDSEKDNRLDESFEGKKNANEQVGNENATKAADKKRRRSASTGSERQILGSKENKKVAKEKSKDKDLSWKKPSKKDKNYREGKKRSKERGRSRSGDRRKSKSPSPRKDKKKNKDRKKKTEKKKELERYDVRKIVKNKEIRKTDAFGRDIISKSRSFSRSRSRSPIRERSRNMLRRDSRSYSRSRSRSFRRGRSPIRRRYLRSRTRSRSKSIRSIRRSYSRSRSRSRSRKSKKKVKSKDRLKLRSRSRGRKSRSISRGRRRSPTRSRSRSPITKIRSKKSGRSRRSWSHHLSRSPSFSPRRSRSITRSPLRVRRSYTRSVSSRSWSRGGSPLPRTSSLEKLTVVLTTKDKKKKKKEGKKSRKEERKRKKTGNSKEVFASGDNVLVSVNFRNNNSVGNNVISSDGRNTRLNSVSPDTEISRKKKKGSDYENEKVTKKSKKSNPISKKVVDVALSSSCTKRVKKLTRLSEKDAEVILNRKPVAVIDLDMSPYREQTPSPVNVVVVSDSGSGDEGKEHTPQRPAARPAAGMEVEVIQENVVSQSVNVSAPSSPVENGYAPTSGPKTPPEPQIKFSINKPQQLRQIANPLGDDDDDDEVEEEEGEQRVESLDRRIEKELNAKNEVPHKGPNTPPAPRGPSTPKTPPSPQTSPDAYDPFEPTKSRSPSPSQADKENRPSPKADGKDDQALGSAQGENAVVSNSSENADKNDVILENHEDKAETLEKGEAVAQVDCSSNVIVNQAAVAPASDIAVNESPERKIGVIITTPQNKTQPQAIQKPYVPVLKQLPMVSTASAAPPATANLTASSDIFSMPSPTKTSRSGATNTTQTSQMTGIQRLQHRLGSPVNRTPNSVKSTPEKRSTPRTETNEIMSSGNYMVRNASKRNGEQPKQPRPLQDTTNETIDMTLDLDDSPYSPASSEGDDLFDPPVEPPKPSNSKPAPSYKTVSKPTHKSPVKQLSKFDLLFGPCGPTLSPVKAGNKKTNAKVPPKAAVLPKVLPPKPQKKPVPANKKNVMHKMDEDQLRILDELPSSAVELQVKDKFLKKLNRQERVVDEVKTVLKPHYARKHITKEEYKDILRRSVPKICHSRSGEINPSKIQSLIEAYVRKFRHAKKKGINAVSKPKTKKTMFS